MTHSNIDFLVIEQGDGRVAMRRNHILRIYETRLEGDDYLAFEMEGGSTIYSTDLTMEDALACPLFRKNERREGAMPGSSDFHFFAIGEEDGGKTAIRTDRIVSIHETDIENEYFLEFRMLGGNELYCHDLKFDDAMKHFTFYELRPQKQSGASPR